MPTPFPPGLKLGVIEPADAVRAFEQRQLLLPSFRWQDVWQEEHQRGFAVAGVMREDVLSVFRDAIDAKFATGGTLADFQKAIKPALAAKGFWGDVEVADPDTGETRITRFDDARLQLIYDVNVRQSYAAGQWQRFQQTKAHLPFVMYKTMEDSHVRPAHAAWDNVVLPMDDAFWQTHWPPNGWRCRCRVVQLNQRSLDRLEASGQKLIRTAPPEADVAYVNPYTGESKQVPRGIDPGFGYNPGVDNSGRDTALSETVLQKAAKSDAYSGAEIATRAAADMPALLAHRTERFARWVDKAQAAAQATGDLFTLGVVTPDIVLALQEANIPLRSAVIALRDKDIDHAVTSGRSRRGVQRESIPLDLYKRLPELLRNPSSVRRDTTDPTALIYVIDVAADDGRLLKIVLRIDFTTKQTLEGQRVVKTVNILRTTSLQDPSNVLDENRFPQVWPRPTTGPSGGGA